MFVTHTPVGRLWQHHTLSHMY